MANNLLLFRKLTGVSRKELSKLLGIRVDTYQMYENGTNLMPDEIVIMLSRIYKIPISCIFCNESYVEALIKDIKSVFDFDEKERTMVLYENLTGKKGTKITFKQVNIIKEEIRTKLQGALL